MPTPPMELHIGDIVQMRKPHPCGGDTWRVVRLGAEIGIRCQTCNRKVLLPRSTFERRVKRLIEHATPNKPRENDRRASTNDHEE